MLADISQPSRGPPFAVMRHFAQGRPTSVTMLAARRPMPGQIRTCTRRRFFDSRRAALPFRRLTRDRCAMAHQQASGPIRTASFAEPAEILPAPNTCLRFREITHHVWMTSAIIFIGTCE